MTGRRWWLVTAGIMAALALAVAGCGGDDEEAADAGTTAAGTSAGGTTGEGEECDTPDKVTLQLKWVTQAQFAGYYAADEQGYYDDNCLDVTIKPGGPDIVPEQVVLGGQAEFGIDWLDNLLATRDQNGDIVNIAQVLARSGMTEITWADSGISDIKQLKD